MSKFTEIRNNLKQINKKKEPDKQYMNNLKGSVKALADDVHKEVGSPISKIKSFFNFFRNLKRDENKGALRKYIKDSIKKNETYIAAKGYSESVKKAMKTGKMYRSEDEAFEEMFSGFSDSEGGDDFKFTSSPSYGPDNDFTSGDKVVSDSVISQTAEINLSMAKNTMTIDNGFIQINDKLSSIHKYFDETQRDFLVKSAENQATTIRLLGEIRDFAKKSIEVDQIVAQNEAIKEATAIDKLLSGDFVGAIKHAGSNIVKEFDRGGYVGMIPMVGQYLNMVKANPFEFLKDEIIDKIPILRKMKQMADPKKLLDSKILGAMGSQNQMVSRVAKAVRGNVVDTSMNIDPGNYVKGKIDFDGVTKKAIVEVIPTYLRKIYSALSGKEEMVFDYNKGVYTKVSVLKSQGEGVFYDNFVGTMNPADMVEAWGKKNNYNNINYSKIRKILDQMVIDLVNSGYDSLKDIIVNWNFEAFNKYVDSNIDETSYNIIRISLLDALSGKAGKDLEDSFYTLETDMKAYFEKRRAGLSGIESAAGKFSGISAILDGSLDEDSFRYRGNQWGPNSNGGGPNGGGNGGGPNGPAAPTKYDFKSNMEKNVVMSDEDLITTNMYADFGADKMDFFNRRAGGMGGMDYIYASSRDQIREIQKKFKERWANMTDEQKRLVKRVVGEDRVNRILNTDINEADDLFLMSNMMNEGFMTTIDDVKSAIYYDKLGRQKNILEGLTSYQKMFEGIGNTTDADKEAAAASMTKKVLAGAGIALGANMLGLMPFVGAFGPGAPIAAAALGIGVGLLGSKKNKALLEQGILTAEEYNQKESLRKRKVSQLATGMGVAAAVALPAAAFMGPLAPLAIGAAGLGAAFMSESSKVKQILFGDKYDPDKPFLDHVKVALLGDGQGDDGLVGKWANPLIKRVKNAAKSVGKGIDDNILKPVKNKIKDAVNWLDGTRFGRSFERIVGVSMKDFGESMNKNVFGPLGKNMFKLIGKGIGWLSPKIGNFFGNTKAPAVLNPAMDPNNPNNQTGSASVGVVSQPSPTTSKPRLSSDIFYSQKDPSYQGLKVGGKSLEDNGCAVMVGAMLVSRITRASVTPEALLPIAEKHAGPTGVHMNFFNDLAVHYKMPKVTEANTFFADEESIKRSIDYFKDGHLFVVLMKTTKNIKYNHFVLVKNMVNGKIIFDDPVAGQDRRLSVKNFAKYVLQVIRFKPKEGFVTGILRRLFRGLFRKTIDRARAKAIEVSTAHLKDKGGEVTAPAEASVGGAGRGSKRAKPVTSNVLGGSSTDYLRMIATDVGYIKDAYTAVNAKKISKYKGLPDGFSMNQEDKQDVKKDGIIKRGFKGILGIGKGAGKLVGKGVGGFFKGGYHAAKWGLGGLWDMGGSGMNLLNELFQAVAEGRLTSEEAQAALQQAQGEKKPGLFRRGLGLGGRVAGKVLGTGFRAGRWGLGKGFRAGRWGLGKGFRAGRWGLGKGFRAGRWGLGGLFDMGVAGAKGVKKHGGDLMDTMYLKYLYGKDWVQNKKDQLKQKGREYWDNAKSGLREGWDTVKGVGSKLWNKAKSFLKLPNLNLDGTRHVKVIGGYLDGVGVVGAVDRDALIETLHGLRAAIKDNSIGSIAIKENKTNKDIDKIQDTERDLDNKQLSILERIANKKNEILGIKETDGNIKRGGKLALGAGGVIAGAASILGPLAAALYMKSDHFKDNVGNAQEAVFGDSDAENTSRLGSRSMLRTAGKNALKMSVNRNVWKTTRRGILGRGMNVVARSHNATQSVIGKAVKGVDSGSVLRTVANKAMYFIRKIINNKFIIRFIPNKLYSAINTGLPKFMDKITKKVGEKIGGSLFKMAGKLLGPILAIWDFKRGLDKAPEYFGVEETAVTPGMRLTSALVSMLQGALSVGIPLILFAFVPTKWLVNIVYKLLVGEEAEKEMADKQAKANKEYEEVKQKYEEKYGKELTKEKYLNDTKKIRKDLGLRVDGDPIFKSDIFNKETSMSVGGDNMTAGDIGCGPYAVAAALTSFGINTDPNTLLARMNSSRTPGQGFTGRQLINQLVGGGVNARMTSNKVFEKHIKNGGKGIAYLRYAEHWIFVHSYDSFSGYVTVDDSKGMFAGKKEPLWNIVYGKATEFIVIEGGKLDANKINNYDGKIPTSDIGGGDTPGGGSHLTKGLNNLNKAIHNGKKPPLPSIVHRNTPTQIYDNKIIKLLEQNNILLAAIVGLLKASNANSDISALGKMIANMQRGDNATKGDDWMRSMSELVKS